jgi:hypothetical protein
MLAIRHVLYCSHLTAGQCPCPKEIKKAQDSTKREGDEKDSAQLPHSVNELKYYHAK